jgi:hypothetical protein
VGRSLLSSLAIAAALGLSGCLLFSDSVNKAPVVTITGPTSVVRGIPMEYTATAKDDKDNQATIRSRWAEFDLKDQGCNAYLASTEWPSSTSVPFASGDAPYTFTADSLKVVCLCVQAADHKGATGQACLRIEPSNPVPIPDIKDVSGFLSGQQRQLCKPIHLSAEGSIYPPGDQPEFLWELKYTGTITAGKAIKLESCKEGVAVDKAKQHRCLAPTVPGPYEVKLTITDTVTVNGNTSTKTSDPFLFQIFVNEDAPPCLVATDPDIFSKLTLLSRSSNLGGTYESRTFWVNNAPDDCEQDSTKLVWSISDSPQTPDKWKFLDNPENQLTISQSQFPNARPGDFVKVRVEVRDTPVSKLYLSGGKVCEETVDICCGQNTQCTGSSNECVQWTTWTVQFQP